MGSKSHERLEGWNATRIIPEECDVDLVIIPVVLALAGVLARTQTCAETTSANPPGQLHQTQPGQSALHPALETLPRARSRLRSRGIVFLTRPSAPQSHWYPGFDSKIEQRATRLLACRPRQADRRVLLR
jgi:hypothetical protein